MRESEAGMTASVILTVVGSDRPGLTQALARAVHAAGGNWLESHLSRLAGLYVGSVLVEIDGAKLAALDAAVQAIDAEGLTVTIVRADGPAPPPEDAQSVTLELVGQDRPGIVNEMTAVLASQRVNIESLTTGIESEAWSGAPLFRARARLILPPSTSVDVLKLQLEGISGEIMVDVTDIGFA